MAAPKITTLCLVLLLGLVLLYAVSTKASTAEGYVGHGEYSEICRWDGRRFCALSDGTAGKCVMNGMCVPSLMA